MPHTGAKHAHRTVVATAILAALALCTTALCCPAPVPATTPIPDAGVSITQPTVEDDQTIATDATPVDDNAPHATQTALPSTAPAAEPKTDAATTAMTEPEPPTGPDMSRALETGMPMSNGVSADPMAFLLSVVAAQQGEGSLVRVAASDTDTGHITYRMALP